VPGLSSERPLGRSRARLVRPGQDGRTPGRPLAGTGAAKADVHADAIGRRGGEAFAFDPFMSPYLETDLDLIVCTPSSRAVVDELRQVPFARWDGDKRHFFPTQRRQSGILMNVHNAWIEAESWQGEDYWNAMQVAREWTKLNHLAHIVDTIRPLGSMMASEMHCNRRR
jgi:hypothetical protein